MLHYWENESDCQKITVYIDTLFQWLPNFYAFKALYEKKF